MKYDDILYMNNNTKITFEYLYKFDDECSVFMLYVENENFKGRHRFFLYIENIRSAYEGLKSLYDSLCGEVCLSDMESESYFSLSANGYENIVLSGNIGGCYDDIKLGFNIKADQTVISVLKNVLKETLYQ